MPCKCEQPVQTWDCEWCHIRWCDTCRPLSTHDVFINMTICQNCEADALAAYQEWLNNYANFADFIGWRQVESLKKVSEFLRILK